MPLSLLASLSVCLPTSNLRSRLFISVLSVTKPKPSQQHIKAHVLRSPLPSLPHLPSPCLPTLILHTDFLVTPQTCLIQLHFCPGPLHLVVPGQKCLCLDIHKTCFFTFFRCCPLSEAFRFYPVWNCNLTPDTHAHIHTHTLSLSLSLFLISLFSTALITT